MSRSRDLLEDAGAVLLAFLALKALGSWGWWRIDWTQVDKGGRGAGPGATSAPVPAGAANLWSEETMRLFAREMAAVPIDARLVLLGIAAASNFNADTEMGDNVGLLLVRRSDLADVGVPIPETFGSLEAPEQIPWIARVLSYRMADDGAEPRWSDSDPGRQRAVGDLAVLLHPVSSAVIEDVVRKEAARRAKDAQGQSLYIHHDNLLRHVLAN